jgi:hypothetical protein
MTIFEVLEKIINKFITIVFSVISTDIADIITALAHLFKASIIMPYFSICSTLKLSNYIEIIKNFEPKILVVGIHQLSNRSQKALPQGSKIGPAKFDF